VRRQRPKLRSLLYRADFWLGRRPRLRSARRSACVRDDRLVEFSQDPTSRSVQTAIEKLKLKVLAAANSAAARSPAVTARPVRQRLRLRLGRLLVRAARFRLWYSPAGVFQAMLANATRICQALLSDLNLHGFHAAAAACSRVQRNSVPSIHMRCMITANRRASATIAFASPF
jgi:hypothetical protein